jgi:hypothetical protein
MCFSTFDRMNFVQQQGKIWLNRSVSPVKMTRFSTPIKRTFHNACAAFQAVANKKAGSESIRS